MIKETVIPTSTIYPLHIPKKWIGKSVTIVYDEEWIETNAAVKNDAFEEAETFFNSVNLDFSNFKFNRDEANER